MQFSLSLRKKYCESLSLNFIFSYGNPIIELEERRMIFEKEEKDREERQRKEDRDFQLQVFRMLCSSQQNTFHFPS